MGNKICIQPYWNIVTETKNKKQTVSAHQSGAIVGKPLPHPPPPVLQRARKISERWWNILMYTIHSYSVSNTVADPWFGEKEAQTEPTKVLRLLVFKYCPSSISWVLKHSNSMVPKYVFWHCGLEYVRYTVCSTSMKDERVWNWFNHLQQYPH